MFWGNASYSFSFLYVTNTQIDWQWISVAIDDSIGISVKNLEFNIEESWDKKYSQLQGS